MKNAVMSVMEMATWRLKMISGGTIFIVRCMSEDDTWENVSAHLTEEGAIARINKEALECGFSPEEKEKYLDYEELKILT